ncbi:MAG: hypothetical protein ACUVUC_16905 [Thermoguttaceae bacterium]
MGRGCAPSWGACTSDGCAILLPMQGHRGAVVDGHEIHGRYERCCPKRPQSYHRAVVFQRVGPGFRFLLDFEWLPPHDDEGAAALRMMHRVLTT